MAYIGQTAPHSSGKNFVCVDDYERAARNKLRPEVLDYYRSGADEEITLRANVSAFSRWKILPRVLRDVSRVDMSLQVFGDHIDCPIGASPTAMQRLAHPDRELGTAYAMHSLNSIMIVSTFASTSLEDIAQSYPNLTKWLQLYLFNDRNAALELIMRAKKAGYKAIVLTVDTPKFGLRRADARNAFKIEPEFVANFEVPDATDQQELCMINASLEWTDVAWLKQVSGLPVLLKGIVTIEDSLLAIKHGADGIVVSNHGGRQLDGVPATVDVLGGICRAVSKKIPVFVDGGIRTGTDVLKCLALGAKMVFVGRPYLWGLACEGKTGAAKVMSMLRSEFELAMQLAGCRCLSDIKPSLVTHETQLLELYSTKVVSKGKNKFKGTLKHLYALKRLVRKMIKLRGLPY